MQEFFLSLLRRAYSAEAAAKAGLGPSTAFGMVSRSNRSVVIKNIAPASSTQPLLLPFGVFTAECAEENLKTEDRGLP